MMIVQDILCEFEALSFRLRISGVIFLIDTHEILKGHLWMQRLHARESCDT